MKARQLGLRKRFMQFMMHENRDFSQFESPMALFNWFVQAWGRPLRPDAMRQAYMAAWAVSIDKGMVKL